MISTSLRPKHTSCNHVRRPSRLLASLLLCCICTSALAQSEALLPFANTAQLTNLQDEERRIWDEAFDADKSLRLRGSLYGDAALDAYLQMLLDDLYPEFKGAVRIKAVNDPSLNAFAMPNGSLYINLGLLARLENEAQLATVLAHEGAHFIQRHGYQQRQSAKGASALALGIGMVGGVVGFLGQLAVVSSMYGFSREHEHEADRIGFERVVKLGYDTEQGMKIFDILREEARILEHKEPFMFASHPKLAERLQNFVDLRAQYPAAQTMRRVEEARFVSHTRQARQHWIEQAFNLSLYKSIVYVLEQPGIDSRYPSHVAYYLGEAYRLRNADNDHAKALQAYQRALQQAPGYAPTYKALGILHFQGGKKDEARGLFQQYLTMAPDASDAPFIQSYLQQIR